MNQTAQPSDARPPNGGFWRRIRLQPGAGSIVAALEDNLHRFDMELHHDGGSVRDISIRAERYPWTTCPGAIDHLRGQANGSSLADLAQLNILEHCTHLFELAVLCAAHAGDSEPTQFDLHVADWNDDATDLELWIDGKRARTVSIKGREVITPGEWFGRDLLLLPHWRGELDAASAEQAMLVARAIYVSMARAAPVVARATDRGPAVLGVCWSYQPGQVGDAAAMPHARKEFAQAGAEPLAGSGLRA